VAKLQGMAQAYLNRRMAVLLFIGFASGLPLPLTIDTLQAWLKDAGVDVTKIAFLSFVGLPYALKFLWSPVMDRFIPPLLDRRRGWLLITQMLLADAVVWLLSDRARQVTGRELVVDAGATLGGA